MTEKRNVNLTHFCYLVAVAKADDKLEDEEIKFLAQKAKELGLSEAEVDKAMDTPGNITDFKPTNKDDAEELLTDIVYLTMVDGDIHKKEYLFCLSIAQELGMEQDYLDHIINLVRKLWKN